MTSSPVNVSSFFSGMTAQTKGMEQTKKGGDFSEIFQTVKDTEPVQKAEDVATESVERDTVQTDNATENQKVDTTKAADEAKDVADTKTDEVKDTDDAAEVTGAEEISEETYEQIMELMKTVISEVKELIAVTLDVPKDEVEAVMDALQFSDADLLNKDVVNQVCRELMGAEDMMALVTDENLLNQMQTVEEGFAELMKSLEETVQSTTNVDVADVLQNVKQMMEEEPLSKTPTITVEVTDELSKPDMGQVQMPKMQDANPKGEEGQNSQMNFAGQNIFAQQNLQNVAAEAMQQAQSTSMSYAQTMDIMNQVMDFMNVSVGLEETTLHMQLHPEELGTVQVQISAKEGVMTAHFTTENEAVKTVLENQIVQLQEKFDAQNIKVEAIEISVEAHGFEENLQKGQAQGREQSQAKKKGTRRIDLTAMDAVTELPEDDRLAAEMMQANGGTVDYMV